MNISRRWLAAFLPSSALPEDGALAAFLTGRGLEIESCTAFASCGLIAGKIAATEAHPRAKKLRICQVLAGGAPLSIVCGAENVAAGQTVVVAPPGANVGGQQIAQRDFQGVNSAGMLCSALEIGVGADGDGIMILADGEAVPGESLDDYLHLPDTVFDAGITPNRGDWLSHLGVAREVAAAAGLPLPAPPPGDKPALNDIFPATILAKDACPYYGGIVIRGAEAGRPSPWWIRALLERCGVRPINASVDITNYVMLATGQPLHAFDLDKLKGGITVRMANKNEEIALLNGDIARCDSDTLLICDENGGVAMGGVMGGMESAVSDATTNIFLEGAFFAPSVVRGRALRHNLNSEAAYRFERGVDPLLPPHALEYAAKLITQVCGGNAGPLNFAGAPPPPPPPIRAKTTQITGLIGIPDWDTPGIAGLLTAAGIAADTAAADEITVSPPSWRFDLETPADLAEEAVRACGYDNLPELPPPGGINIAANPPLPFSAENARRRMASLGFSETITYAFVPPQWEEKLSAGRGAPVALKNPINSEMSVMRTTLLGGLIDRALFNLNRKCERVRLFEIGRCFVFAEKNAPWEDEQPLFIAAVAAGNAAPAQWGEKTRECDFFDIKGDIERFLRPAGEVLFCDSAPRPAFYHPHKSVNIVVCANGEKTTIGAAGILHPETAAAFGLHHPPPVFELRLQSLSAIRRLPQAQPVSRFPLVRRDLSVIADAPAKSVLKCIRAVAHDGMHCAAVLFDLYENDNIGDGHKKCYGIRLTMQGIEKNLTNEDIRRTLDATVAALAAAGMTLRQ